MQTGRRFSLRSVISFVVLTGLVLYAIAFAIHTLPTNTSAKRGTSEIAALDIVSGDITKDNRTAILNNLNYLTGKSLSWSDISYRQNSYNKEFTDYGQSINFTIDVAQVKSSYDVYLQGGDTVPVRPSIYCAQNPLPGYGCYFNPSLNTGDS